MDKAQIKEKYEHFKQWQEKPHDYKLLSNEVQHCNNCGNDFTGNFCPICSQKAGMGRIGWHSVHQGVMDIWGLGTRSLLYSIWQLLLRPGHIISDYIDGKRQVSFPPVKMLFIVAVIYSFVAFWLLPNVFHLSIEKDLGTAKEYYLWYKNHLSWAMLITSTLAILPTWVMFRYSPRHTHHTLPEGFFIQVFFQVISVVVSFLFIPLDYSKSPFLSFSSTLVTAVYYVIGYKQIFGYSLWGTLWRQGFVLLCSLFTQSIVMLAAFPPPIIKDFKTADSPFVQNGYFIGLIIAAVMIPLIILGIGHVVNLIATRKYRKEYKKASTRENT